MAERHRAGSGLMVERKRVDGTAQGWLDHMAASSRGRVLHPFQLSLSRPGIGQRLSDGGSAKTLLC